MIQKCEDSESNAFPELKGPVIIFPPSYYNDEKKTKYDSTKKYDIHPSVDEKWFCIIDTIPSQANRMEPIFKREEFKNLLPFHISIKRDNEKHDALDFFTHRAGDSAVRKCEEENKEENTTPFNEKVKEALLDL